MINISFAQKLNVPTQYDRPEPLLEVTTRGSRIQVVAANVSLM
jgi:hypothetical protein